jgi:hypothetical protein
MIILGLTDRRVRRKAGLTARQRGKSARQRLPSDPDGHGGRPRARIRQRGRCSSTTTKAYCNFMYPSPTHRARTVPEMLEGTTSLLPSLTARRDRHAARMTVLPVSRSSLRETRVIGKPRKSAIRASRLMDANMGST